MKAPKWIAFALALVMLCGTLLTVSATEETALPEEMTQIQPEVIPEEHVEIPEEVPEEVPEEMPEHPARTEEEKEAYRQERLARRDEKIAAARQRQQDRVADREQRQAEAAQHRKERIEAREQRQTEAAQRKEQRQSPGKTQP